ncbi:MAG: hypothetical protein C0404_01485 [Verrucomicrobia bacterium]|nr:hypothetical protein [Verrucomicrobiota bacterium]
MPLTSPEPTAPVPTTITRLPASFLRLAFRYSTHMSSISMRRSSGPVTLRMLFETCSADEIHSLTMPSAHPAFTA